VLKWWNEESKRSPDVIFQLTGINFKHAKHAQTYELAF
jgi:hypothetical protein